MNRISAILALCCPLIISADPTFVTSTFDTGTEGWQPWAVAMDAGGITADNPYLKVEADGIGKFGRMITFNWETAWTGNYIGAGVSGLQLDLSNMSSDDDVYLRVIIGNRASPQQEGGTWWISKTATVIPVESGWGSYAIPIAEEEMQIVGNIMGESGTDSFTETLNDVQNIRIVSSSFPQGAIGDEFFGDVGIDNVALVPEPTTLPMIGTGLIMIYLYRKKRAGELPAPKTLGRSNQRR